MAFDVLIEVKFLLECYNNTPVEREELLARIRDLYSTGIISNYAIEQMHDILGDGDEQL